MHTSTHYLMRVSNSKWPAAVKNKRPDSLTGSLHLLQRMRLPRGCRYFPLRLMVWRSDLLSIFLLLHR